MNTSYTTDNVQYVEFTENGETKRRNCSLEVMRAFDKRYDEIQHAIGTARTKQQERNAQKRYDTLIAWLRRNS